MKVIGHRGAAGLAPENTLASIKAAIAAGVDAVEFDIRKTSDDVLVLCHDKSLLRTYGVDIDIAGSTYDDIKSIASPAGNTVPTLEQALRITGQVPVLIEGKGEGWASTLAKFLINHPNKELVTVISFHHQELFIFGQKCPSAKLYALEHHTAMDALNAARMFGFDGIDVNFWVMNPLVYWLCKRHNLETTVYTLNWPWVAQVFRLLYPGLAITTNVPNKLQFVRDKQKRTPSQVKS